jgi:HEAT repeat protein
MALIRKLSEATAQPQARIEEALATLLAQLESDDAAQRRAAAHALPRDAEASAALARRLPAETDAAARDAMLSALARNGDDTACAGLVACLRSEDALLRNAAIEALKTMPLAIAPLMDDLLADPDADVRIFAINVLESLRHARVEAWLIDVIDGDSEVNVCATAVDLLVEVGTEAAREALERLRLRFPGEPYLGFAIGVALARIGKASAA